MMLGAIIRIKFNLSIFFIVLFEIKANDRFKPHYIAANLT